MERSSGSEGDSQDDDADEDENDEEDEDEEEDEDHDEDEDEDEGEDGMSEDHDHYDEEDMDEDSEDEDDVDDNYTSQRETPKKPEPKIPLVKLRPDGSPLIWRSTQNILMGHGWNICETDPMVANFDSNHEMWAHLEPGDYISIFAAARFSGWRCSGRRAVLLFGKRFDLL